MLPVFLFVFRVVNNEHTFSVPITLTGIFVANRATHSGNPSQGLKEILFFVSAGRISLFSITESEL